MKVLVVIDMQNDFIDGSLGTKEAVEIVDRVQEEIELFRKNGDTVIFTRDTHAENYLSTAEGKNLPVEHCIKGSFGWEISEKLDTKDSVIFDKPTFGSTELANYLSKTEGISEIEIVGLCTDICVISNALMIKAYLPETPITVKSELCAGVTPESHLRALESMKMCQVQIQ
ncbi:MAG: cysteine hydrolase family protein [Acutalibacteraceae bacterium]